MRSNVPGKSVIRRSQEPGCNRPVDIDKHISEIDRSFALNFPEHAKFANPFTLTIAQSRLDLR